MAESEGQQNQNVEDDDDAGKVAYKPPAEKSIGEILQTDQEDESLKRYKEQLLGQAVAANETEYWKDRPNVIVRKMAVIFEDHETKELDLEDKESLKDLKFKIKEGVKYRIMVTFNVQREICPGLSLHNVVSRAVFKTTEKFMVGSYGPRKDVYEYSSPWDEFPSGMMNRGEYKVKSVFKDDDGKEIYSWEWKFDLKKDWKD